MKYRTKEKVEIKIWGKDSTMDCFNFAPLHFYNMPDKQNKMKLHFISDSMNSNPNTFTPVFDGMVIVKHDPEWFEWLPEDYFNAIYEVV